MTGKIKFPRHRLLRCRRPTYSPVPMCNRTTFSATIQLRQSDQSDQYQLQQHIFQLRLWFDSQLRFHPRRLDESSSVETQGVRSRIQIAGFSSPFFDPNRNTAASWLKAAVGPNSAPEIRHRCQGVAARYKIACSPACFPAPFSTSVGTQSQAGPKLRPEQSEHHEG